MYSQRRGGFETQMPGSNVCRRRNVTASAVMSQGDWHTGNMMTDGKLVGAPEVDVPKEKV